MIHTADLAWIAGFLEGEGSFVGSMSNGQITVSAVQVNPEPLVKMQRVVAGQLYQYTNKQGCTFWRWTLNGSYAIGLAFTLYPWLSRRRRQQVGAMVGKWKSRPGRNNSLKTRCPYGHEYTFYRVGRRRNCMACYRMWKRQPRHHVMAGAPTGELQEQNP